MFQQHIRNVLTLVFADIFIVSLSFSLAIMGTRFLQSSHLVGGDSRVYLVYITLFVLVISLFYILGLYDHTLLSRKHLVFVSISIALFFIIVISSSLSSFIYHLNPRRTTYIFFYFLTILMMFGFRLVYNKYTLF